MSARLMSDARRKGALRDLHEQREELLGERTLDERRAKQGRDSETALAAKS